ncbi:MAG: hypothetical protein IJN79_05470 [Clostridia bacterium]|nr:hypothetical protein [Clostridia bacterium]MBQ6858527.1 hypothetical protein [Clostridia bacterium]MBQ7052224.1 hypothetical protein [Clostridia bacterium]
MMKRKFLASVMLALVLALMLCGAALAAQEPVTVDQEVIITLSGTLPKHKETFTVVMQALDDSNPMPGGQTGGTYSIEILGEEKTGNSGWFPTMTFDHVGVYKYRIWQEPGTHERGTYDDTVYTMTATVTNTADFEGFEVVVSFRDDEGGPKPDNNLFHNEYTVVNGSATPTGVADDWPVYFAASGVLMLLSLFLMTKLRRREAVETDAGEAYLDEDEFDA